VAHRREGLPRPRRGSKGDALASRGRGEPYSHRRREQGRSGAAHPRGAELQRAAVEEDRPNWPLTLPIGAAEGTARTVG
jgi:hypothetical protein